MATKFEEQVPLIPLSNTDARQTDDTRGSSDSNGGYSLWVAICFAINYTIGAGILGLPMEFYNAGLLLASVIIVCLAVATYVVCLYVIDGIYRAESISTILQENLATVSKYDLISNKRNIKQRLMQNARTGHHLQNEVPSVTFEKIQANYVIVRNEYQLSELIGIFGSKWWRFAYDICYGCMAFSTLWAYNVLFGVSLARNIALGPYSTCNRETDNSTSCRNLYSIYVFVFWIWSTVMTLLDFRHQKWLQVSATIARACIIVLMVITAVGLSLSHWYYDGDSYVYDASYVALDDNDVSVWKWRGVPWMIAVGAFAYGISVNAIDVINPMSTRDKQEKMTTLWSVAITLCMIVYVVCGTTIVTYFGSYVTSPCSLGWLGFMGFEFTDTRPVWALLVSWIIILLPALDISSCFPLIGTTAANTVHAFVFGILAHYDMLDDEDLAAYDHGVPGENAQEQDADTPWMEHWYRHRHLIVIKIILCTFVSSLALIESDFEFVLSLAGAFGLLAVYVGPCVLHWKSSQFMRDICVDRDDVELEQKIDVADTPISTRWRAHNAWLFVIPILSLVAFLTAMVQSFM